MKKKAKQICCILALMSVFTFSAGITALTASAEVTTTVNAETSVEATQQVGEVKKLVAALESDVYFVNGIPYVDIIKEGTANGTRSSSETVAVIPDLMVNASGYITKAYTTLKGDIEIPETVENQVIIGIEPKVFNKKYMSKIIFPATIIDIQSQAFISCRFLETIEWKSPEFGEEVRGLTIQSRAFFNCPQLVEVTLPKRLASLATDAFHNAISLRNIYIEKGCAGYRNGTGGYAGVVYTTDQEVNSVATSYIWPQKKEYYTIHLIAGTSSAEIDKFVVAGNHPIDLPTVVNGKSVSGWYLDAEFTSEMYTTEYFVAENEDVTSYTLYAKIENSVPTNSYVLTFDLQGGTQSQLENPMVLPMGEELNLSAYLPEREGYDFAGWYSLPAKNGNKIVDETGMGTSFSEDIGSMTLYAAWTAHRYTINFIDYTNEIVFELGLDYGSIISAHLRERIGYEFEGWFDGFEEGSVNYTGPDSVFSTDAWRVEEDRTLDFYAHYRAIQYDYSVYCAKCDEQHSFGKATYDQSVTIDAHCNHPGYELGGWGTDDATYTESFVWKYTEVKVFNVVWEAKEYAITYIEDNVEIPAPNGFPTTYTIESNFTFPTLTRVGYNDIYLRDGMNNRLTGIAPGRTDDLKLYIVKDNPVKVNVTLNYYGVYANEVKELTYGNTYTLPTDKGLADYRYDGWEDPQGNKLANTNISNLLTNTTYYIRWIGTVTLKNENGSNIGIVDLQYGKAFSIEPYEKVGHTFNGWSTSQTSNAYITDATGDGIGVFNLQNSLILYARTTANTYTITFDNQEGQGGASRLDVVYGTNSQAVQIPYKMGYNFKGYYTQPNGAGDCYFNQNGQYTQGSTWVIEDDLHLYAKWETIRFSATLTNNIQTLSYTITAKNKNNQRVSISNFAHFEIKVFLKSNSTLIKTITTTSMVYDLSTLNYYDNCLLQGTVYFQHNNQSIGSINLDTIELAYKSDGTLDDFIYEPGQTRLYLIVNYDLNVTISVPPEIRVLNLKGVNSATASIEILSSSDVYVNLYNVNIACGRTYGATIEKSSGRLYINALGNSYLEGCEGHAGIAYRYNSSAAIRAPQVYISVESNSLLEIVGGNNIERGWCGGTHGYKGSNGADATGTAETGGAGKNGSNGQDGELDGHVAIECNYISVTGSGVVKITGGDGAPGGNGGNGGNGGTGGPGQDAGFIFVKGGKGGTGGAAGNGGDGGNGANGGAPIGAFTTNGSYSIVASMSNNGICYLIGGDGGKGGNGGNPGTPGSGGKGGSGVWNDNGAQGDMGASGQKGSDGEDGLGYVVAYVSGAVCINGQNGAAETYPDY